MREAWGEDTNFWTNRTACDTLSGIRKCCETLNFSPIMGLVNEAQIFFDRMEAGLGDHRDLIKLNQLRSDGKKELKKLKASIENAKKELKLLKSEKRRKKK